MENFIDSPTFTFVIIAIALWTLPWKGVALWRASQRREKKWFIALLIFNTLAVLEILYIFDFSKRHSKKEIGNHGE